MVKFGSYSYSCSYCKCWLILNFFKILMKLAIICLIIYDVTIIKMTSNKWRIYCKQWSSSNPTVLLILLSLSLRCSWNSSLVSKIIPRCLWFVDWITTILLKFNNGWSGLLSFLEKNNFLWLLIGIWIKTHFPLKFPFVYLL